MFIKIIKHYRNKIRRKIAAVSSFEDKVKYYRKLGMKIGEGCHIYTNEIGREPYLIEIGNNVSIGYQTSLITHDGATWALNQTNHKDKLVYGKIKIGDNTIIGWKCLILYNTDIGADCVISAGSVVKGKIPDDSVVMGNPAKVVMKTSMLKKLFIANPNCLDTEKLTKEERDILLRNHFNIADTPNG